MNTMQQSRWGAFKYNFVRSNYITFAWNWFLGLAGKAAEPFLFASVLYSGYKLLPGVTLPSTGVDAFMFVAQVAMLDIGGMALMKLAHQRHMSKKSFTYCVGIVLVGLMIATVTLATLERLIPAITGNIALAIEGCLLVARSIMAVLYGYAVHSLRDEQPEGVQPQSVQPVQVVQPAPAQRHETSVHVHPVQPVHLRPFTCPPGHLIAETPVHHVQPKSVQVEQSVRQASNVSMFPVQVGRASSKTKPGDRTNIDEQARSILERQPNISVRELARELGIPSSTAANIRKRVS